jgi:large subunit ribosomal protein L15
VKKNQKKIIKNNTVNMLTLNNLVTTTTKKKRVGRGGNRGKNAGAGHKGQLKRAGKTRVGFEGGGQSMIRRTPKIKGYKFTGKINKGLEVLPLSYLDQYLEDGSEVTLDLLKDKGLLKKLTKKVRIIANRKISKSFKFDTNNDSVYLSKGAKQYFK